MLKRLHLQNFTVFADADFEFSPGLNVLVGTNGTGKSHVLKVGYAVLYAATGRLKNSGPRQVKDLDAASLANGTRPSWSAHNWSIELGNKLKAVFRPDTNELLELVRHNSLPVKADITAILGNNRLLESRVTILQINPTDLELKTDYLSDREQNDNVAAPVFIPAKEVLTLSWILALYDFRQVPIDETYPDLLRLISLPLLKAPTANILQALEQLLNVLGGRVEEESGRYYLSVQKQPRLEMNMVAEGLRKFAVLYKLLVNGALISQTTLFWDEPEANLNPALLRQLAAILAELARQGFQIIMATHSMSLLKEFHILSRQKEKGDLPIKYFGLNAGQGEATRVVATDNFEHLPDVVALEVELEQADELDIIFAREDQERNANYNRAE